VVATYRDAGISGAKGRDKRPGLDAMLKDAGPRKFGIVMAWAIDRLGRSLIDLLRTIQDLEAVGVDLYLDQQHLDTTTPTGKLLFQVTGAFSEFERAMIRQRVRAGLRFSGAFLRLWAAYSILHAELPVFERDVPSIGDHGEAYHQQKRGWLTRAAWHFISLAEGAAQASVPHPPTATASLTAAPAVPVAPAPLEVVLNLLTLLGCEHFRRLAQRLRKALACCVGEGHLLDAERLDGSPVDAGLRQ